jgi:uncharacterized RDD family membrane protein YckC
MTAYCAGCGIENSDDAGSCPYCGGEPPSNGDGKNDAVHDEQKLFVNLSDHPIGYLLREWKMMNRATQFLFPVLLLIVGIKKLFKRPFLGPVFNASIPKYRAAVPEEISRLNPKATYGPAMAYLEGQGYKHCLDLSCRHHLQNVIKRVYVNGDQTRYATIFINAAVGKVQFISLEAFTVRKKYIVLLNRETLPITFPKSVIFQTVHGASPQELSEAFDNTVKKNDEALVPLSLGRYLRIHFKVDKFLIAQAIRQGLFLTSNSEKGRTTPVSSICVNHPMRAAVRRCRQCGVLLCEFCYTAANGASYCNHCITGVLHASMPEADGRTPVISLPSPAAALPKLADGDLFAGLGARGLAKIIDLAAIVGVVAILAYGLNLGLGVVAGSYARALSIVSVQLLAASATILHLTIVFRRLGGGIGHRILGLRVVNKDGAVPSLISVGIRLMYHLMSFLFIIPAIGYLLIPFSRKKRGWHDLLADTWVVTRHPKKTAIIGWLALLSICGTCMWVGFGYWQSFFSGSSPDIALEPVWETKLDKSYASGPDLLSGKVVLTRNSGKLTALDLQTGETRWSIDANDKMWIQSWSNDVNAPVILSTADASETVLLRLRPEDGKVLWRRGTGIKTARMIVDRRGILVRNDSHLKWYDVDGNAVWQLDSPVSKDASVTINGDIFIASFQPQEANADAEPGARPKLTADITCISLTDGTTKWQDTHSSDYATAMPLENGYYLVNKPKEPMRMVYLPERRTIWTASTSLDKRFIAAKQDRAVKPPGPPLLYTDEKMIVGVDGSVGFDYPPHKGLPIVTDQWLILMAANAGQGQDAKSLRMHLLVIDRFDGKPLITLSATRYRNIAYLSEDEFSIYLLGMNPPQGIFDKTFSFRLLQIEKHTRRLIEINLGVKSRPWGLHVRAFEDGRRIFIATSGQMGTYLLPSARQ